MAVEIERYIVELGTEGRLIEMQLEEVMVGVAGDKAALVRDYPQTVQRLPTLSLNKIRGGIPAPLRGVVWQSAAGSREKLIEDQYDALCGESSPYENIINKDLGRSFPGVEMFKDPEGEGQKMLGRVLKCFSLYDHKIGYCQGLGFLVGPLLMQMGDKEAFCVLVR